MKTLNKTPPKGYKDTLYQAQSHMTNSARLFSRIIHLRPVELFSDFLAATFLRPLPILVASVTAVIIPACLWIVAKYFGYSLSGSESIVSFILGWLVGYIIDYAKILATGKSH